MSLLDTKDVFVLASHKYSCVYLSGLYKHGSETVGGCKKFDGFFSRSGIAMFEICN